MVKTTFDPLIFFGKHPNRRHETAYLVFMHKLITHIDVKEVKLWSNEMIPFMNFELKRTSLWADCPSWNHFLVVYWVIKVDWLSSQWLYGLAWQECRLTISWRSETPQQNPPIENPNDSKRAPSQCMDSPLIFHTRSG